MNAMGEHREALERILGGRIEQSGSRVVPGLSDVPGVEVVYFSDDGTNTFQVQFEKISEFASPPNAVRGGVNERGCKLTPPGGPSFHAIGYHGDLEGWRKDIEIGAKGLGLLLARIHGDALVISDGRLSVKKRWLTSWACTERSSAISNRARRIAGCPRCYD